MIKINPCNCHSEWTLSEVEGFISESETPEVSGQIDSLVVI